MRVLLATAVAATGLLATHAAPAQAGFAGGLLRVGAPLKLTSFKQIGTVDPTRLAAAGNTACFVESPFGPEVNAAFSQIQVAFQMRCQDLTTGFPSTEVTSAFMRGEIRRTNGVRHAGPFDNVGINAVSVVAVGPVSFGSYLGHVRVEVVYLGALFFAEYDTARVLNVF